MRADGKIVLAVTGGIGSGKSAVCSILGRRGIPVYDSDSRTKALYDEIPGLASRISCALGADVTSADGKIDRRKLAAAVFSDSARLRQLEEIVYPEVKRDFLAWKAAFPASPIVAIESAVILEKPLFMDVFDKVLMVNAPVELRIERAAARDGAAREKILARVAEQKALESTPEGVLPEGVDFIIENDGDLAALELKTDEIIDILKMKTDLKKILTISGQSGLFRYLSQGRSGVIVESLSDGRRSCFGLKSKVTTLEDISIYTDEGEVRLRDLFTKMYETLGEESAPASKSSDKELQDFFAKVQPDYDRDRFHISHMKKVVTWYNLLKDFASLDFETEEEPSAGSDAAAQE